MCDTQSLGQILQTVAVLPAACNDIEAIPAKRAKSSPPNISLLIRGESRLLMMEGNLWADK
jgi:hypothetical protein